MSRPLPEDLEYLSHYGVKGMKWGVINEDQPVGDSQGSALNPKPVTRTKLQQDVVDRLGPLGYNEGRMNRAFGPESSNPPKHPSTVKDSKYKLLTPAQKRKLLIAGGVVLAGAAAYGLHRAGVNAEELGPLNAQISLMNDLKTASGHFGYDPDMIAKMSTDRLNLSPGDIVKRVSMSKETAIRDNFFAAVNDRDVDRYKAILPVYWQSWTGKSNPEGYVVSMKAVKNITAPSQRETLGIFKSMLDDDFTLPGSGETTKLRSYLSKASGLTDDDELSARYLHEFAGQWNDPSNVFTKGMFTRLKNLGFNAVPDMNDANNLANAPHIFFDGKAFQIAGHELHGKKEILSAQKAILDLVHALWIRGKGLMEVLQEDIDFLEHFGVRGMHWGVRKDRASGVSKKTDHEARKDAEEFARAKQFYGVGAGTRRKHIRDSVDAKTRRDPDYKKAFDHHLGKQDASTHVEKAKKERSKIDTRTKRKQRTGAVARRFTGEQGTQAAFVAVGLGGAAYLRSSKGQQHMAKTVKAVKKFKDSQKSKKTADYLANYFARNG